MTTLAGVAGIAGSTNGIGQFSTFRTPVGVSISPDGVSAFVADEHSHLIRHIIVSTANVTTLAGLAGVSGNVNGIGTNARFNGPFGVVISSDGVFALVGELYNLKIRRIALSTGFVTSLASSEGSNGLQTSAGFRHYGGISLSPDGVYALAVQWSSHFICKIVIHPMTPPGSLTPSFPLYSFTVKISDGEIFLDYLSDVKKGLPDSFRVYFLSDFCLRKDDTKRINPHRMGTCNCWRD